MATTLTLRSRTNPGDTTTASSLTYDQVDDNFISLKTNKAELVSPEFSGTPRTPTVGSTENSTVIASTAFVQAVATVREQSANDNSVAMAIALG